MDGQAAAPVYLNGNIRGGEKPFFLELLFFLNHTEELLLKA